uniref:helicase SRCAP n=1 Tax=Euleptes europaea TaxID=460621 RepID=UPI00253FC5EF|nr:helicase SRCAP [Euleptes europaea]
MQNSPTQQHHALHMQVELEIASDRMTGSNPVSPASSGSPSSSGSISPPHLTHDSSLDSHLGFDGPKAQNRTLVSPGMYTSSDPASMWDKTHAEIAEQAKHEAEIENRIAEMKKEGFWSLKRLSKVPEPARPKVHWDYLCEEMQWLSADFAQERRWKRGVARKVVRMVIRHHEEQKQKEERAKREEQAKLRRIASSIAKEVKQFWSNVEKVVQFKQQSRLEEKRKKALDLQLDFIVGQTEKYSDLLTQSLNETLPVTSKTSSSHAGSTASSPPPPSQLIEDEDGDFQPHEESDDEETIEVEEQQEGNDSETRQREIELLKQEGELPLEELLQSLPPQILENSFSTSPCASSSDNEEEEEDSEEEEEQEEKHISKNLKEKPKPVTQRNKKPWKPDEEDEEFTANEEEAEDEEETIDAEEKLEGDVDHSKELDDLAKEGELPMEELLQKYAGAYASDFEMEESDASSEASEPSTSEYEEESEEEDTSSQSDSTEEVGSEQDESEEEVAIEEEASTNQEEDFGVEYLLKQDEDRGGEGDNDSAPAPGPKKEITDIAAAAESLQPKGYTLATTQVKTPIPYLLRGTLREYQHIGLDWLVTMYEKKLNGILADEMGLGKTIQTISLLAHLACEKGSWGPHLIIVPTSVMLNWEMEIKRWCPSFKILTYYGAQKERKLKRQGWTKPNAFHICITSYKLVLQDHQAFRRKNWKYLILDEAQNIKNFKSQRWQSLLNFNSQRRLLLTGTPLQNSLMELWSLMHFLMPHVFQSHREFKEWFSNPLTGMIEGSQEYNENLVKRLHKVLRPFLLRRVKVDVEKQMPKKYEHVIKCRLSKRQRYLYDDFMAQATTKETLATGHFMSVINILMQLRKVCNHPNLFDPRPIHSPFITEGVCFNTASLVLHTLDNDPFKHADMGIFDLINLEDRVSRYETDTFLPKWKVTRKLIEEIAESPDPPPRPKPVKMKVNRMLQPVPKPENRTVVLVNNPRPAAPLQRPMTPLLPEALTTALAPIHHQGPVLPGSVLSPVLPVSVSLPVPPSPVTMSIPVPPSARPQTPTLVPPLSQNNTAAALLHTQASAPQVLPMAMTAAQLMPNASRPTLPPPPISATATATSSLKLGIGPAPVGQLQAPNTLAVSAMGQLQGMSAVGQPQAPSTLAMSGMGQPQAPNTLAVSSVGQLQGMSVVGQPQGPNPLAMSGMGQPQAPSTLSVSTVGQPQGMSVVGQPQGPSTMVMSGMGQPQVVSTVGQLQSPSTLVMSALGQPQAPNTLAVSAVGQTQASNTLAVSSVGHLQVPNTLAASAVGQPQAPNTLAMSVVGQPQAPNTLAVSVVGQPQAPNTLAMPSAGQPQAPNTLGPAPAAQQSTSTMGPGAIGGMLKPMNIHSAVPALPGYNFATAGALQQRFLLSPDMQARLPSGEVVSIGQLASLANRPLQSAPGSKPLTFQIQGNKLTLTGTQVRQVTVPQPARQLPRNVVHLVSAGGQHHIISQPAQVALIQAMAQQAGQSPVGMQAVPGHQPPTILPVPATSTAAAAVASTATISVPIAATQVPSSAVNSSGVVKIVVRQAPRDGLVPPSPGPQQPPLRPATPTTATALPGLPASLMAQRTPLPMNPVPPVRIPTQPPMRPSTPAPLQALVRPTLRVLQAPNPSMEQQLVSASLSSSVAPFALSPAATVAVSASPAMAPQATSSPVPRDEPEMLLLRSTTPTPPPPSILAPRPRRQPPPPPRSPFYLESLEEKRKKQKEERLDRLFRLNEQHCNLAPIYGMEVLRFCTLFPPVPAASWRNEEEESEERAGAARDVEPQGWRGASYTHCFAAQVQRDPQSLAAYWQRSEALAQTILMPQQRIKQLTNIIERFIFVMPPVEAPAITMHTSHPPPSLLLQQAVFKETLRQELSSRARCLHRIVCNMRTQFPDLRLIQYDCGKLQTLDILLRQLKAGAHRVLIFTQMTRMLDVLEQFLNYHGHIYLRLDGSTRVEQRQALMERFNADKRIFCFILSTRSGGVGVNLTGADTVVFYDSDWNPTMDAQAQDRCHRIGQTRDVHIYRLISERTVEENILKKANQKRMLGDMAIEGGNFTTAYFKQQTIRDLFEMPLDEPGKKEGEAPLPAQEEEEDPMATKQAQILEQALCKAEDPEDIRAATQAKAEQVAELAEFNENIPLDTEDRPSREEEEEMSKAEQEIASLVEQLTPIERYAMNFLEASLEDVSREELKQAEEQVEAARKDIDQAKDEVVFKLPEDEDESLLTEEGSSKKSKKGKGSSRTASERTGTRMSERLRSTRQMLRDGDGGDAESPQARLPHLRHSRATAEEEDDGLPQVAQHTRSAAIRRELVRDETAAHSVPHSRRTVARREELWAKPPAGGERLQKMALHRTEALASCDRILRTNPHRTDIPPTGEKLRVTPPKPDLGAAGDRIPRGTQPVGDRLPRGALQRTDASVDKVLRPGQQKLEKPLGLDKLQSSPARPEAPTSESQIPQLHPQGLDREAIKLKVDLREQKEGEVARCRPSSPGLQISEEVPSVEVPACLAQDGSVADEKPLNIQTPSDTEKAVLKVSEKTPGPFTPVATVELPYESKLEDTHAGVLAVGVQEECLSKPEEKADKSSAAEQRDSLNSVDGVPTPGAHDRAPLDSVGRTVSEEATRQSSEAAPPENPGAVMLESLSEATNVGGPARTSPDRSVAAAGCLPQLEIPSRVKEQNGLEQPPRTGGLPCPLPNFPNELKPKTSPPETALPAPEPAGSETSCLKGPLKQGPGVVGKLLPEDELQNNKDDVPASCPEAESVQEGPLTAAAVISPGAPSSDENPSPARVPRRRTSADVLILQSSQGKDGPAAKVLRKLPGRLVTVVEEKELIRRRRRNRARRLNAASSSTVLSPSNSSAQSVSEPETSPSSKELPLLRDLPARRRIELESRAAAKEKDGCPREELLVNASAEPVKRKRGRPPKNKTTEQQSSGLTRPCLEPALETNPQSKAPEKVPELQPPNKAPEKKAPKTISAKRESLKSKVQSSKNDIPVEKRRRGRPPKVREPPIIPPKSSASDTLPASLTNPLITELSAKGPEQLNTPVGPAPLTEATSRSTSISKTSPKGRNRMTTHPKPTSKSVPTAQDFVTRPPKPLPKSPTEACETLASPPAAQPFLEEQGLPSPPRPFPQTTPTPPSAETPPKRKRGRPPKNSPSACVEVAQPPPSTSDQETSVENQAPAPPVRKRRRRRRKDELGPALPSVNQSSSEGEDARPLTRLALLKREEKPELSSEGLVQPSPKHVGAEGPSSAESSTGEQPSSDAPSRSTRLRPGSLVPPLEWETQRRKRRCSLGGSRLSNSSRSPVPQAVSEPEGGESESSLRSSSESSGNKSAQQPKRQCRQSAGARGRGRGQRHRGGLASRVLRSGAKPAESSRSASSPVPTRKAGPASTSAGAMSAAPSAATSLAAPLTSSLSNRGRKPKT